MSLAILRTSTGAFDVLSASLDLRLEGVPLYAVELDAAEAPTGRVELVFATGPSFVGTVARATAFEGRVEAVICGGSGGLSLEAELAIELTGAGYTGTPLVVDGALVLGDILVAAGDELSPDVDTAALTLPRWQRVAGFAGRAIALLAEAWAASWRVRADGLLWIGAETWTAYVDEANVIEQGDSADVAEVSAALVVDRPDIAPGMTVGGRRVERVFYSLDGASLRARLTYQTSNRGGSLKAALGPAPSLYGASHLAKVVQQRADGTLDLIPDSAAIGGATGINRVPLRLGLYGAKQTLGTGAVVALRFASSSTFPLGDPRLPYAESFDMVAADRPVARKGEPVILGSVTYIATLSPPLITVTFTPSGGPYGSPGLPIVLALVGTITSPGSTEPSVPFDLVGYVSSGSPEISLRRLDTEDIP